MATGARGEGVLNVGERTYTLLYTNRALAEAERATSKTITEIARGMSAGSVGVGDVAAMLLVGMEHARRETRAGGRSYTLNDAWAILDQIGFPSVAAAVMEAVAAVLTYSPDGEGEPDADRPTT